MQRKQFIYAGLAISVLTLFYYGFMLGDRPFATPDEARYVEIPREILATGDFITPRLNGVKYFEKPPLFYWLQAGMMKAFGASEFSMRLLTSVVAVSGVVATFAFAASFYGLLVGTGAALILATSPLYFGLAHMILLDMSASVFVTLSLFSFYKAITSLPPISPSVIARPRLGTKQSRKASNLEVAHGLLRFARNDGGGWRRRLWFWGFAAACGLGVMTKGIMALALPGPVIVAWLTLTKQWGGLRPFYPFSSIMIFLGLVVPWHAAVSLANPEFAHKYFIVEHLWRFTTSYHARYQPIWFFVPVVLLGLLPWVALLRTPSLSRLRRDPLILYLSLWAGWVVLFFSIGNSKLIPYVLPAFPPLAILLALRWAEVRKAWLITACVLAFIINMATIAGAPYIQKPSVKTLIADVPLRLDDRPGDRLVSYHTYFQDLPVYANRLVTVVGYKGELDFGCSVEDTSAWMIEEAEFLNLWQSKERLWTVMRLGSFHEFRKNNPDFFIKIYRQTPTYVLVVNHDISP